MQVGGHSSVSSYKCSFKSNSHAGILVSGSGMHARMIAEHCTSRMNTGAGFAVEGGGELQLSTCSSSSDFVGVSAQGEGIFPNLVCEFKFPARCS